MIGSCRGEDVDLKSIRDIRFSDLGDFNGGCGIDTGRCRALTLVWEANDLMDTMDGRT